ncbi:hypothetical protein E2C01_019732 [Portunus trituberculatus]|uniref:Uncharacterized protein n=1 Tax=Portunus trituberculatus TaxID=210409 RepID=A0A5B7DYF4_PORTR|nr:hypothetical protein [Portunus trituberculatus]
MSDKRFDMEHHNLSNANKVRSEASHRVLCNVCGELGAGTSKEEHPNGSITSPHPRIDPAVTYPNRLPNWLVSCSPALQQYHLCGACHGGGGGGDDDGVKREG